MIHIGKEIHEEMLRQGNNPTWLAERLGCHVTTVHAIYHRQHMKTELLTRLCGILNKDFYLLLSNDLLSPDPLPPLPPKRMNGPQKKNITGTDGKED